MTIQLISNGMFNDKTELIDHSIDEHINNKVLLIAISFVFFLIHDFIACGI